MATLYFKTSYHNWWLCWGLNPRFKSLLFWFLGFWGFFLVYWVFISCSFNYLFIFCLFFIIHYIIIFVGGFKILQKIFPKTLRKKVRLLAKAIHQPYAFMWRLRLESVGFRKRWPDHISVQIYLFRQFYCDAWTWLDSN